MAIHPDLSRERELWQQGLELIAGVDEVGRGCWAGPVVAAAVIVPFGLVESEKLPLVRDSKKLTAQQREELAPQIIRQCLGWGLGLATVREIDQLNILQATYLAMQRALSQVSPWNYALIDGKISGQTNFGGAWKAMIQGDNFSYSIACAAILAKVKRDRWMTHLSNRYPHYHWAGNKGYGTKAHHQALQQYGVSPWHRRSFAPIKALISQN